MERSQTENQPRVSGSQRAGGGSTKGDLSVTNTFCFVLQVGKKLMQRSEPPSRKLNVTQKTDFSDKDKEDQLFFFT